MKQKKVTIDGEDLDLFEGGLKLGVTLEISDISNLSVTKNSRTTSLTVPGTAKNKKKLRFPEDWNASDPIDQSEKPVANAEVEGTEVFSGYAKVEEATTENGITDYKIRLIGDNGDWRELIKNKKISDLDYSSDNHILNIPTVEASWTLSPTRNYVYDLIDRGKFTGGTQAGNPPVNSGNYVNIEDCYPAISFISIFTKAFNAVGYTLVSNFINSVPFNRLYLPFINAALKHPANWKDDKKFKGVMLNPAGSQYHFWKVASVNNVIFPVSFYNDITNDGTDPKNLYDVRNENVDYIPVNAGTIPYTGKNYKTFKAPNKCGYKFRYKLQYYLNGPIGSGSGGTHFNLYKKKVGSQTKEVVHEFSIAYLLTLLQTVDVTTDFIQLDPGDIVWLEADMRYGVTTAAVSLNIYTHVSGGPESFLELIDCDILPVVTAGDTVDMNSNLPEILQLDFIQGVKDLYNLNFYPDIKTRTIYIEPRDNFYSGTAIDWSKKLDLGKPIQIKQIGDSYTKRLRYKFKEDPSDKFVQEWNKEREDSFGSHEQTLGNAFLKDATTDYQNKIFAATWMDIAPAPLLGLRTVKIPRMWSDVSQPPHSTAFAPRVLYYDGLKNLPANDRFSLYTRDNVAGTNLIRHYTVYPRFYSYGENAGDYNFHYNDVGTGRGLFQTYYRNTHSVIDDSRLVVANFYLKDPDISNFNFRVPVYVEEGGNGAFFIVQKIDDFDTDSAETAPVELIKIISNAPLVELTAPISRGTDPTQRGAIRIEKRNDDDIVIVGGHEIIKVSPSGEIKHKGGPLYTRVNDNIIVPVMFTEDGELKVVYKSDQ